MLRSKSALEAALSAEGGAAMAALVGKVKAAANMLYDFTLKEEYVSEKAVQAPACRDQSCTQPICDLRQS
jgi:hypothetical protein